MVDDFHWQTKTTRLIILLVLLGILLRGTNFFLFGNHYLQSGSDPLYITAIKDHLLEYLLYFHTKPIGTIFRDALSLALFGSENIALGNLIFTSILDCFATAFVFLTLISLRIPALFAFLLSILWSVALIAWEYWRLSSHFDHLNVFLFSFFAWTLCWRYFQTNRLITDLTAGFSGGLLILFHSVAPMLVPILLILTQQRPTFEGRCLRKLFVAFIIPFLLILFTSGKNFIQFGIPTTSTIAGSTAMQFVSLYRLDKLTAFVNQHDYPQWWRWCYTTGSNNYSDDIGKCSGALYGQCFKSPNGQYSFSQLEEKLIALGENSLYQIVQQDRLVAQEAPWKLSGGVGESNTRFAIEYGKVSGRVWKDFLIERPHEFFLHFARANCVFLLGVDFLGGNRYEPQHMPRHWLVRLAGHLVAPVLFIGIIGAWIIIALTGFAMLKPQLAAFLPGDHKNVQHILMVFSVGLCLTSIALNALICCENERMFVSLSPFAMLIGGYYLWWMWRYIKKVH